MICRLRVKFVCITMTLVTVMLSLLLVTQYSSTKTALERSSLSALQAASHEPLNGGPPGFGQRERPCFSLALTDWGTLMASGSGYYDLTDQDALLTVYSLALEDGRTTGVLENFDLRYYRAEDPLGLRYVFTDISGEIQTLRELRRGSAAVGGLGFLGFLILSVALANWAIRPVEEAWKQQRQFVADASHELKTPLTVILTNAELLGEPECTPEQRRQFTDSILTMSRQMRTLVEDLLQLARADSGQTEAEREKLDFSRLLEETLLPFEPVYFEAGLTLESSIVPSVYLMGNAPQLRQVAEILLDNACKYATPGGVVTLTLSKQGHQCLLTVASPGETLTEQQCRDIFRRFYRADAARSSRGYGLGLSIAQRVVTDHRGKIWAEGKHGVNTFFVSLPVG